MYFLVLWNVITFLAYFIDDILPVVLVRPSEHHYITFWFPFNVAQSSYLH